MPKNIQKNAIADNDFGINDKLLKFSNEIFLLLSSIYRYLPRLAPMESGFILKLTAEMKMM